MSQNKNYTPHFEAASTVQDMLAGHLVPQPEQVEFTETPEHTLPGAGSVVVLGQRHSEFDKVKQVQAIDTLTGETTDANVHTAEGFYGPTGEAADYAALTIHGLSTAEGMRTTYGEGAKFAKMLEDGVPTEVLVFSSESRWPNEALRDEPIQHTIGNRNVTTAVALTAGMRHQLEKDDVSNVTIHSVQGRESLNEAGYNFVDRPGVEPTAILRAAKAVAARRSEETGERVDPKRLFIDDDEELQSDIAATGERSARHMADDIDTLIHDTIESDEIQQKLENGSRVVVVLATHSMDLKALARWHVDEETAHQSAGYGNSEQVVLERKPDGTYQHLWSTSLS